MKWRGSDELEAMLADVADLVPDPRNARKHGERNLQAIVASLERFGQVKPIVVRDGVVIAGNGTLAAARRLGWEQIAVVAVPGTMTDEEARAFALADNRTAELAEWDRAELAVILSELPESLRAPLDFSAEDAKMEVEAKALPPNNLQQATQLRPSREYVVIMCDEGNDEWEALKVALSLMPVRRGGYKPGSQFDSVGTERVVKARRLLELIGAHSHPVQEPTQ